MNKITYFLAVFCFLILVISCSKEPTAVLPHAPELPEVAFDYQSISDEFATFKLPKTLKVGENEITTGNISEEIVLNANTLIPELASNEVIELGRVLFYDNRLSKNNSIACASCHQQNFAFADGLATSPGFAGQITRRNSMSLANPVAKEHFFWDGRVSSLESLALEPVFNHIEMGMNSHEELIAKLEKEAYYPELFDKAYGTSRITKNRIEEAIGQFVSSIFKADSKFDEGLTNGFANMSELEKHGMALFFSDETQCASCHNGANFATPTFSGQNSIQHNPYAVTSGTTNIGLDLVYDDPGFADGKFSIPSLRNIALTAPYMHDGRFNTLREVLDHYNEGVQEHKDLDPKLLRSGKAQRMGLTELDLQAMEAFMLTLTSKTITTDVRFSNPFKS